MTMRSSIAISAFLLTVIGCWSVFTHTLLPQVSAQTTPSFSQLLTSPPSVTAPSLITPSTQLATPAAQASPAATLIPTPTPIAAPSSAINLTLTPITLQMQVKPGETQTSEIKVRNNGAQDEPLRLSFGSFSFNEQTQQLDLNATAPVETLQWISVDRSEIIVKPGEWESVKVTFAPTSDATLSYYYAIIFSRIDQVTPTDPTLTKLSGAPAVLVLASLDSPLTRRELQVESFSVPKVWVEFLPQTFMLNIRNTGNVPVAPTGNIFIDSSRKKDIGVLSANPKNNIVLPDTMRELTTSWDDGFPKWQPTTDKEAPTNPDGTVKQELHWDFSQVDRFRIGKYTAHLLLVYDNGERDIPIESYVSFWVIPWRISLAFLAVLIFFLIGIRSSLVSLYRSVRHKKPHIS